MSGRAAPAGEVRCPRCGGPFHCGAADPEPCACTGLALSPALLAELRQRYAGCLCGGCLRALATAGTGHGTTPTAIAPGTAG